MRETDGYMRGDTSKRGEWERIFGSGSRSIGLGSIAGFLLLMAAVFPDWIGLMIGWDSDRHDGSVERVIVAGLSLATVLLFVLAAVEWRWR